MYLPPGNDSLKTDRSNSSKVLFAHAARWARSFLSTWARASSIASGVADTAIPVAVRILEAPPPLMPSNPVWQPRTTRQSTGARTSHIDRVRLCMTVLLLCREIHCLCREIHCLEHG